MGNCDRKEGARRRPGVGATDTAAVARATCAGGGGDAANERSERPDLSVAAGHRRPAKLEDERAVR